MTIEGSEAEHVELTFKEKFKLLDEQKKKAFQKYMRWKFSFYNATNISYAKKNSVLMQHDQEF